MGETFYKGKAKSDKDQDQFLVIKILEDGNDIIACYISTFIFKTLDEFSF